MTVHVAVLSTVRFVWLTELVTVSTNSGGTFTGGCAPVPTHCLSMKIR